MASKVKNTAYTVIYMSLFVWLVPLSGSTQPSPTPTIQKKILVNEYAPFWSLPSEDALLPHTIRLRAGGTDLVIPDSMYKVEDNRIIWTAPIAALPLPLEISYRIYPEWLARMKQHLGQPPPDSGGTGVFPGRVYTPYQEASTLINFRKTAYSGSFSRGFSAGNRQDLALQSSFNLQLAGDLGDGMEILAAISDAQLPLQPEGNSLQLRDFDRIFVQLSRAGKQLTAGDLDL